MVGQDLVHDIGMGDERNQIPDLCLMCLFSCLGGRVGRQREGNCMPLVGKVFRGLRPIGITPGGKVFRF